MPSLGVDPNRPTAHQRQVGQQPGFSTKRPGHGRARGVWEGYCKDHPEIAPGHEGRQHVKLGL